MNNEQEKIMLGFALAVTLFAAVILTWRATRYSMEREAIANGVGHWTHVDGERTFAWGAPQEGR